VGRGGNRVRHSSVIESMFYTGWKMAINAYVSYTDCLCLGQARREPQRGPGKHYRGALDLFPLLYVLRSRRRRRRSGSREEGNVGKNVPSPSD